MERKAARREDYRSLINYVSLRGGVSYNRAHLVVKTLSAVLKRNVKKGNSLELPGLFKIIFTSSIGTIYNNKVMGLNDQVEEVSGELKFSSHDVRSLLSLYYERMRNLVEMGYQINVKGVGYVIPKEDNEGVYCDTRVSPALSKPEVADFFILKESGDLELTQLGRENLRFRIELDDSIRIPFRVMTGNKLQLDTVEI
ncbi:hypothetical protein [Bacillus licheniformis]